MCSAPTPIPDYLLHFLAQFPEVIRLTAALQQAVKTSDPPSFHAITLIPTEFRIQQEERWQSVVLLRLIACRGYTDLLGRVPPLCFNRRLLHSDPLAGRHLKATSQE